MDKALFESLLNISRNDVLFREVLINLCFEAFGR